MFLILTEIILMPVLLRIGVAIIICKSPKKVLASIVQEADGHQYPAAPILTSTGDLSESRTRIMALKGPRPNH